MTQTNMLTKHLTGISPYAVLLGLILFSSCNEKQKDNKYPYQNPALPVEERVSAIIGRMTVEEKVLQLDMFWGNEVTPMTGHEATEYSEEQAAKILGTTSIGSI